METNDHFDIFADMWKDDISDDIIWSIAVIIEAGDMFESDLVNQSGPRTLEESMEIGWRLLKVLPAVELSRLSDAQIERYIDEEATVACRHPDYADPQGLP